MIEIISAPFDNGGRRIGSRLGPDAIRLCGIGDALIQLGFEVADRGDVFVIDGEQPEIIRWIASLKSSIISILEDGNLPLMLGGEHTLAAAGISAAENMFGAEFAVLWIDAHADIHTPDTSTTGNIHGMPVAAVQGLRTSIPLPGSKWDSLVDHLGPLYVSPTNTIWLGLRDVDLPERPRVKKGLALTMHELDRFGIEACVRKINHHLEQIGTNKLWISFDVDVLDPLLAPGTGTAVRGGLTYREANLLAELLYESSHGPSSKFELIGLDIVEVNPLLDANNQTALLATEWVASLLGKTIL